MPSTAYQDTRSLGRGSTFVSNGALFDARLKPATQATYAKLLHVAWLHRPDRREQSVLGVPVVMPAQRELARELGLSPTTVHRHLGALRAAGYLDWRRASKRAPLTYRFFGEPQEAYPAWPGERECSVSGALSVPLVVQPRARHNGVEDGKSDYVGLTIVSPPRAAVAASGESVAPFRVLLEECGVRDDERTRRQTAIALNGIRALHQVELERAGVQVDDVDAALVAAIRRKAGLYATVMPGAELTPMALHSYWLDVELRIAPTSTAVTS